MPMGEQVFIDHGYDSSSIFATNFFDGPDFTSATLRSLLHVTNRSKRQLANDLWTELESGAISPTSVIAALVAQPRTWLSFKVPSVRSGIDLPPQRAAAALCTSFGEDGWYGPLVDPATQTPRWYIRSVKVPTFRKIGSTDLKFSYARWLVFADISPKRLALSWNGFTYRPESKNLENSQFQFWERLPGFFEELERLTGGGWKHPNLNKLVLEKLWPHYEGRAPFEWSHIRVRAERSGVALSAKSAMPSVVEFEGKGLTVLTRELASTVSKTLEITDEDTVQKIEREILVTLIKKWGAMSYEFLIETQPGGKDKQERLFQAHCYFGVRSREHGQDGFQHIKTYRELGGSARALDFLLPFV